MAAAKIEHRIGVKASAETVWELVSNLDTWESWNPLYPKAAGALRIGAPLDLILALPGKPSRVIQPIVVDWVPLEQLHWQQSGMGGLVRSIRYIEIEALQEDGCVVSNGEIFTGLLGPRVARSLRKPIRQGFTAMGEALRDRAEAAWRDRAGTPTSAS